jgi:hypothetical protein
VVLVCLHLSLDQHLGHLDVLGVDAVGLDASQALLVGADKLFRAKELSLKATMKSE